MLQRPGSLGYSPSLLWLSVPSGPGVLAGYSCVLDPGRREPAQTGQPDPDHATAAACEAGQVRAAYYMFLTQQ